MLTQMVRLCRERGYRLVLVVFPMEMQLSPVALQLYRDSLHVRLGTEATSGEPQKRIRDFGSAHEITVVDLLPAFRMADPGELYLRNKAIELDPFHPSPLGHRIAAEEILRALAPRKLPLRVVSDRGLPQPNVLASRWTVQSGYLRIAPRRAACVFDWIHVLICLCFEPGGATEWPGPPS